MKKLIDSKIVLASTVLAAALTMACASDADIARVQGNQNGVDSGMTDSGGATADSGPDTSSPGVDGGSDAAASCHAVAATGNVVVPYTVNAYLPAQTGGVVVDGTYDLVDDYYYAGPGAKPGPSTQGTNRSTCVVKGATWECAGVVVLSKDGTTFSSASTTTNVPSGISMSTTVTCASDPAQVGSTGTTPYSATANTLTVTKVFANDEGYVQVYQRRP